MEMIILHVYLGSVKCNLAYFKSFINCFGDYHTNIFVSWEV